MSRPTFDPRVLRNCARTISTDVEILEERHDFQAPPMLAALPAELEDEAQKQEASHARHGATLKARTYRHVAMHLSATLELERGPIFEQFTGADLATDLLSSRAAGWNRTAARLDASSSASSSGTDVPKPLRGIAREDLDPLTAAALAGLLRWHIESPTPGDLKTRANIIRLYTETVAPLGGPRAATAAYVAGRLLGIAQSSDGAGLEKLAEELEQAAGVTRA